MITLHSKIIFYMLKVTVLGSGTSQGVPMIGCHCKVCSSSNPKDKRLRSSIMIENEYGDNIVVDAGPDFRYQMLREGVEKLDAILLTHHHKDHTGGIDDVRAFNYILNKDMKIYGEEYVLNSVKHDYGYAFEKNRYPGVPNIDLHQILEGEKFEVERFSIEPIRGFHHKLPIFGFRIENFAYLTDLNSISDAELAKLEGLDTLIITALRVKKHISHFSLFESLEIIKRLKPKRAFLTHSSHQIGLYDEISKELPSGVKLAYDGLKIIIN